jgi:hypothetical protein
MAQSASQNTCSGNCPSTQTSNNEICRVVTQSDGNLVIYNAANQAVWASGTNGRGAPPYQAVMQSDGNYVLYDANGTALWASGSNGKGSPPYQLIMQDDCNLVVYDQSNQATWATGTNVASGESARDLKASVCKSNPNGLSNLNGEIDSCTSTTEVKRNNNFATNTFKLQQDIISLSGSVMDSLSMGDTMFGQFGYNDIAKQVKGRNEELKRKKDGLMNEVEKGESIIEKTNRDFEDEYKTVPEPQPKKVLRFIEDYTVAILVISYLFMVIAAIYIFTSMSTDKFATFGKLLVGSILLSMFMFMVLFYLT